MITIGPTPVSPSKRKSPLCWLFSMYTPHHTTPHHITPHHTTLILPLTRAQFALGPVTLSAKGTLYDDEEAFVVEDGQYVSGRWPGDAYLYVSHLFVILLSKFIYLCLFVFICLFLYLLDMERRWYRRCMNMMQISNRCSSVHPATTTTTYFLNKSGR